MRVLCARGCDNATQRAAPISTAMIGIILMLSPEEFFSLQFILKTKNVFTEITFSGDRRVFSINLVISPYF
jgi:hypothetical protein